MKQASLMGVTGDFIIHVIPLLFILSSSTISAQTASLEATLSLKQVSGVMVPYQNGFALPSFEKQNRKILDLRGDWKKQRFAASDNVTLAKRDSTGYHNLMTEAAGRNSSSFDVSGWETKSLPAVENHMNAYPTVPEYYQDGVWYRRSFTVDPADSMAFVKLNFYAVNYVADVWLNDFYLGYHEGGYTPFSFDISKALKYGGPNVLVVRVDNPMWNSRNDIVPYTNCDWFNYTGIIHDVYLEFASPVSVIRNDIVPLNLDASVQSTVVVRNIHHNAASVDVTMQAFEALIDSSNITTEFSYQLLAGNHVAMTQTSLTIPSDSIGVWRTSLAIDNPVLWTPKQPHLYIMKVTLKQGGNVIDEFSSQFGIRTATTSGNKFLLNSRAVFFTGAARHEDHPVYGRSVPKEIIFSDLELVKRTNVNFLRTAHYPNNLYTYLIADRLGIAALEEIPVWWFDTPAAWQIQNDTRHIHEQMFREMVFKDYNRPSIILWSTCNECLDVSNRKEFIDKVNQDLDTNYPDGRLVTQSAAADRPGATDDSQNACDVSGWTMYFGIFHGSTYFTGTYAFLNSAESFNPNKPIIDTEFGYWSSENSSTEQTQVDVFTNTFLAFQQHAALSAAGTININGSLMSCTWWCMFDWYSHGHPSGFQSMGLYSMDRTRAKPVAAVVKNSYVPYFNFDGVSTQIDGENRSIPDNVELMQNYPNPFNPETVIEYTVGGVRAQGPGVSVKLTVFDLLGRQVTVPVNERKAPGTYQVTFEGTGLASGMYFYRLSANGYVQTRKMILQK